MSMSAQDTRDMAADQRRESADRCDECQTPFGSGSGQVRKARGIVSKDFREMAVCVGCGTAIYGDTNLDGEPIDPDDQGDGT